MRTFKATYRDRTGEQRESAKFYVEFRDQKDVIRRLPAFGDRRQSAALGKRLESLGVVLASGDTPSRDTSQWLGTLPTRLQRALVRIGMLDSKRLAAGRPLAAHVEDYRQALVAKGDTAEYAAVQSNRLLRLAEGCGFAKYADIDADKVLAYLAGLREGARGYGTCATNKYLIAIRHFCDWMIAGKRASESPVKHLKTGNPEPDRKQPRRGLTDAEVGALLTAAESGPEYRGISGRDRGVLYRVAIETGLRAGELSKALVRDFDLDAGTVTIAAAHSKHRREDTLPLRSDTVSLLAEYFRDKMRDALAFRTPEADKMAEMVQEDLARAGVPIVDEAGRRVVFHSLRHTFCSRLAKAGVHPKMLMDLARHTNIQTTMQYYTHTAVADRAQALEALPTLAGIAATGTQSKTG